MFVGIIQAYRGRTTTTGRTDRGQRRRRWDGHDGTDEQWTDDDGTDDGTDGRTLDDDGDGTVTTGCMYTTGQTDDTYVYIYIYIHIYIYLSHSLVMFW